MILGAIGLMVIVASATKSWWFPEGLRDRWHEAWTSYPEGAEDPRAALLASHTRRMAEMESQFREMIMKEKARNTGLLAEKARLSGTPTVP